VRYGNVVGSRGSVIPIFIQQRESGKLSITDERMTRFWLTLDQGVHFVIRAIENMIGGEVFVPKIPSTRICDLARAIAPDADLDVVGIRPGEKLHEVLIHEDEARTAVELEDMFVVLPTAQEIGFARQCRSAWESRGKALPDGFRYTSDTNPRWLSIQEIRQLVAPFEAEVSQ
jgi:UDP-N-acetylglucosamine 4,6-dehydratase